MTDIGGEDAAASISGGNSSDVEDPKLTSTTKVSFGEDVIDNEASESTRSRPSLRDVKGKLKSVRHDISLSERRFNVKTLPVDMQRVYQELTDKHGEEYGLVWLFSMRTAVELHRGWHMPLLTSKILQQIKDKFKIRMTWNLGVVKLIFRVEDGGFEIHRKVPFDYDSEFQDLYTKTAAALVGGHITVHEALIHQTEIKKGMHTATSGQLFQRNYPGRLLLYPWQAATCAIIFFGGSYSDAGVAAICGFVAGLLEWGIGTVGGDFKILNDIIVGLSTGIIASLFYQYESPIYCLKGIFLGTLYWFFYGTAFVIGILEIIAGELETGVTRFVGVAIKTFVLSLGAALGMSLVLSDLPYDVWYAQANNCGKDNVFTTEAWARILMYLLCSGAALAQYRFPIVNYWRALAVQLAGYEVQYQMQKILVDRQKDDYLDNAISNIVGAVAAVVVSEVIAYVVDNILYHYNARILQRQKSDSKMSDFFYQVTAFFVRLNHFFRMGKKADYDVLQLDKKLRQQRAELYDSYHSRESINLDANEERLLFDAIISAEPVSTWSILMPAVYQLVPGSIIANLWFNSIYPPKESSPENDVFSILMVISTSLALGLLVGFNITRFGGVLLNRLFSRGIEDKEKMDEDIDYRKTVMAFAEHDDDPRERREESLRAQSFQDQTQTDN
mmetsp:Transcript_1003/g.1540  ORF Transcript_1003/g.1540 Transcript_1003/m.1540 type:complete len:672 (-) Transcript_1003:155-2170(-)|eukprot:CAMPEP_0194202858 /NCGR_PEP_ID=MMETSP0156-20130528/2777_1 /TAXON_ID=33649 /ORGANISM="Thalassionema nitzschioides, Strain L26-B" /LENGTH=671 /DNA_ID=CAMNT_0038928465 /DNA_START=58 /DNA_END=2073 /DNA_ORIENTATION=-